MEVFRQKLLFIIEAHGEIIWKKYNPNLSLLTTSPVWPKGELSKNQAG
jgi:hypothetical protein